MTGPSTLSTRRVKVLQGLLAGGVVLGVAMLSAGYLAGIPIVLGPVLQLFTCSPDQRRQILSLDTLRSPRDQRRALTIVAVILIVVGALAAYAKNRDQRCDALKARLEELRRGSDEQSFDDLMQLQDDPYEAIRITADLGRRNCP